MAGWIKLYRDVMVSKTFQKLTAIQKLIAIYILLNANHKDGLWFDLYKGVEVLVKRGQLITSRKKIIEDWFKNDRSVTDQKVRTTLAKLVNLGFITIESTNWYTLITVVNYEVYQGDISESNQQVNLDLTNTQPALNQRLTINKNEMNVNKVKKNKEKPLINYSEFVSMTMDSYNLLVEKYGEEKTKLMIEILDNYKGSNNKKYADDYRAILSWVVKRVHEEPNSFNGRDARKNKSITGGKSGWIRKTRDIQLPNLQ